MATTDAIVLGGGLAGLAAARELARAGLTVEVLDRREIGRGASWAGAGLLAPFSDPGDEPAFLDLLRTSRNGWRAWLETIESESGVPVEYDARGALVVARTAEEEHRVDRLERACLAVDEPVAGFALADAYREVPDLTPGATRVLHLPLEHRVDNVQATAALAVAATRAGVILSPGVTARRIRFGRHAVDVETSDGPRSAGLAVVATGAWTREVAGLPELPIRPVRGQIVLLEGVAWPWTGCVRGLDRYVVRRGPNGLLAGSTIEEAGFAEHPTPEGIAKILEFALDLFPGLRHSRIVATWAGLRPGSPDGRPILDRLGDGPVVLACGHYRNGILLAPWTGRAAARLALGDEPIDHPALFARDRFDVVFADRSL